MPAGLYQRPVRRQLRYFHVFVDNLCKIAGDKDLQAVEDFLGWLDRFSNTNDVKFTVTISADEELATEGLRQYT